MKWPLGEPGAHLLLSIALSNGVWFIDIAVCLFVCFPTVPLVLARKEKFTV